MLTLSQHNKSMKDFAEMLRQQNKAGVACDKCGVEMIYEGKTSDRPSQHVICPKCNQRGTKIEKA